MEEKNNPTNNQKKEQNLSLYNIFRVVPKDATKAISDGRLKGKTDINPMWRIKLLTEVFGPCGIGWKIEVVKKWIESSDDNTSAAFVDVNLYIRDEKTGQWSDPIPGNGGNIFKRKENSGNIYTDDDCFKKATSDAIGSAAKLLGVGADIYWESDATKYTSGTSGAVSQPTIKNRPSQTRLAVCPENESLWNQSVAIAAGTSDTPEKIRKRIELKYDITDENFNRLMKESGKA